MIQPAEAKLVGRASSPPAVPSAPFVPTAPEPYPIPIVHRAVVGRQRRSNGMVVLLVVFVLLIAGGAGSLYFFLTESNPLVSHQTTPQPSANATTITPATGTVVTSTTTPSDPYTHKGILVLDDPLSDNSKGYGWEEGLRDFGYCQFTAGTYHATQPQSGLFHSCIALNTQFANFVYEVQMTIISGDYGGIVFRADRATTHFYYFRLSLDGQYSLTIHMDKTANAPVLAQGGVPSLNTSLGQSNLVAIVANGASITLYMNNQLLTNVTDSTYNQGQIGVFAGDITNSADVVFSNVKVWKL